MEFFKALTPTPHNEGEHSVSSVVSVMVLCSKHTLDPQVYASGRLGHARILPLCLKTNYVEHRGKIFSDEAGDDGSRRADEKV